MFHKLFTIFIIAGILANVAQANTRSFTPCLSDTLTTSENREVNLGAAVVTSTRPPKPLANNTIRTRLITAEDIRKSNAADIQQLLQAELPGVEFSYALSQQVHMNLAGFGGQRVLFLVDGERMAGETMDNIDFSRINLANVERVEVIKGSASAIYGSNAAGGVINIITRKGNRKAWNLQTEVRQSAHNKRLIAVQHGVNLTRWRQNFALQHSAQDTYSLHNSKSTPQDSRYVLQNIQGGRTWDMSETLGWYPNHRFNLTAKAGYFFREREHDENERQRFRDFSAHLKGEWHPTEEQRVELTYVFDQYDKSDLYTRAHLDIRDYSNVQHSWRLFYALPLSWSTTLTSGVNAMRDYLLSYQFSNGNSYHQWTAGAFAQIDWNIAPHWELIAAGRYDYLNARNLSHPTAKLALKYQRKSFTLRGGYGGGFRPPSLKERHMHFHLNDIFIIRGHHDLKPEFSHGFNLSAELFRKQWHIETALHYHRVRDRITTTLPTHERDTRTHLPFVDYVNVPQLNIFHFETSMQRRWGWKNTNFSARLNYAFTHEKGTTTGSLTPYMPTRPHSLTTQFNFHHTPWSNYAYNLILSGRWLSSVLAEEYNLTRHTVNRFRYPAYAIVKLSWLQQFKQGIHLNFEIDNLLNYKPQIYYYNSPPTTGTTLSVGIKLLLDELK